MTLERFQSCSKFTCALNALQCAIFTSSIHVRHASSGPIYLSRFNALLATLRSDYIETNILTICWSQNCLGLLARNSFYYAFRMACLK